jgi:hypothetical protein
MALNRKLGHGARLFPLRGISRNFYIVELLRM